jgi:hypothetical protein
MKFSARLFPLLAGLCVVSIALAEEPDIAVQSRATSEEKVSIDWIETESAYVFESGLIHGGANFGDQSSLQSRFEYNHRFLIKDPIYLRLGLAYNRFDFGQTAAPVPVHLQSMAAIIGVDYMHGGDIGAFIWVKPGFYTEEHIGIASFNAPITLGRAFILQPDHLYLFVGANADFLRGDYPVLPLAGLMWRPNDQWEVALIVPEPRVTYKPTKSFEIYAGGELAGGSFRTDHDPAIQPRKLDGAQIDYSEYRANAGFSYSPSANLSIDLAGGYAIQRQFAFTRADYYFRSDPAPFVRLEVSAKF